MFRDCGECTACCTWLIGDSDTCYPKTLYNNSEFDSDPFNFNNYSYYFKEDDYVS